MNFSGKHQNFATISLVATGLLALLVAVHPIFLLGVAAVAVIFRDSLWEGFSVLFERQNASWVPILFFVPLCLHLFGKQGGLPFAAPDDLMRHLTAYQAGFDYSSRFVHQAIVLPENRSLWFGYEWIAGRLHAWVGGALAAFMLIAACIGLVYVVTRAAFARAAAGHPEQVLIVAAAMVLFVAHFTVNRALLGRPEIIVSMVGLSACVLRARTWVVLMSLSAPLYWLTPIFVPFALLLPGGWRLRLVSGFVVGVMSAGFWLGYMGWDWLELIRKTSDAASSRLISPTEGGPIVTALLQPHIGLPLLIALAVIRASSWKRLIAPVLLIGWFFLPDQSRYLGSVLLPLAGVIFVMEVSGREFSLTSSQRAWIVAGLLLIASGSLLERPDNRLWNKPHLKSLSGDEVLLLPFDESAFFLMYRHPKTQMWPSMEFGYSTQAMQRFYVQIKENRTVDCAKLNSLEFTHFLDHGIIAGTVPKCLIPQEKYLHWTLFRIEKDASLQNP